MSAAKTTKQSDHGIYAETVSDTDLQLSKISLTKTKDPKRLNVEYTHKNGKKGPLLRDTLPNTFSYGPRVQLNYTEKMSGMKDEDCKKEGFNLPFPLQISKEEVKMSPEQEKWYKVHMKIIERVKALMDETPSMWSEDESAKVSILDLNSCMSFKKKDGKKDRTAPPTCNPKLRVIKKGISNEYGMQITTKFYDENLEPVDPLTLVGRCGHIDAILHYDSVYLSPKPSLQVKVWETIFKPIAGGDNPSVLLKRDRPKTLAPPTADDDAKEDLDKDDDEPKEESEKPDEDAGSVKADEDDDEPTPPPKPKPVATVKKAPAPRNIVSSVKAPPKPVKKA